AGTSSRKTQASTSGERSPAGCKQATGRQDASPLRRGIAPRTNTLGVGKPPRRTFALGLRSAEATAGAVLRRRRSGTRRVPVSGLSSALGGCPRRDGVETWFRALRNTHLWSARPGLCVPAFARRRRLRFLQ